MVRFNVALPKGRPSIAKCWADNSVGASLRGHDAMNGKGRRRSLKAWLEPVLIHRSTMPTSIACGCIYCQV